MTPEELIAPRRQPSSRADFARLRHRLRPLLHDALRGEPPPHRAHDLRALEKAGHITRRSVRQAYDEKAGMFLPDRFVKGTCPNCRTPDQYGDSCENCGATYAPTDLIDPVSVVSGTRP